MRRTNPSQQGGIAATRALRLNKALAKGQIQQQANAEAMAKVAEAAKRQRLLDDTIPMEVRFPHTIDTDTVCTACGAYFVTNDDLSLTMVHEDGCLYVQILDDEAKQYELA